MLHEQQKRFVSSMEIVAESTVCKWFASEMVILIWKTENVPAGLQSLMMIKS